MFTLIFNKYVINNYYYKYVVNEYVPLLLAVFCLYSVDIQRSSNQAPVV